MFREGIGKPVPSLFALPPPKVDKKVGKAICFTRSKRQKWILEKWILRLYTFRCSGNQMFGDFLTSFFAFEHLTTSFYITCICCNITEQSQKKKEYNFQQTYPIILDRFVAIIQSESER